MYCDSLSVYLIVFSLCVRRWKLVYSDSLSGFLMGFRCRYLEDSDILVVAKSSSQ